MRLAGTTNYRRKILDSSLDEVLFRTLTDQLIKQPGVDTNKQRLDSTAVRSAIRGLTRLGILVEAVSKFLQKLNRKKPDQYAHVNAQLVRISCLCSVSAVVEVVGTFLRSEAIDPFSKAMPKIGNCPFLGAVK